jgi:hypothetical protein
MIVGIVLAAGGKMQQVVDVALEAVQVSKQAGSLGAGEGDQLAEIVTQRAQGSVEPRQAGGGPGDELTDGRWRCPESSAGGATAPLTGIGVFP